MYDILPMILNNVNQLLNYVLLSVVYVFFVGLRGDITYILFVETPRKFITAVYKAFDP
jgi:hypothetical protein